MIIAVDCDIKQQNKQTSVYWPLVNSLHADKLCALSSADFFQNAFRNMIRVSNSLDPDQV